MMQAHIIGGVPVSSLTCDQLASQLLHDKNEGGDTPKLVFSMNGEGISAYNSNHEFRALVDQADLIHPDGMSVVWAGRLFAGGAFPERVATTDAFHNVARLAQREGLSFFFLGATEEVNKKAVANVQQAYPELKIAGRRNGYFTDTETQTVCDQINASGADVVWVALGRPKQEKWCAENKSKLSNVTWLKTCGGLFDFLSGSKPRAPEIMQALGLEWLFRLANDPRRLFKRYLTTNVHSIYCYLFKSRKTRHD